MYKYAQDRKQDRTSMTSDDSKWLIASKVENLYVDGGQHNRSKWNTISFVIVEDVDLLSIRYAVPVAGKSGNRHKNRRDDSVWLGHTEKVG